MKSSIMVGLLIFAFSVPAFAQDDSAINPPDFAMKKVVSRILTWYFKPRQKPNKIYFSAEGIKQEWLPEIKNIEFVLPQSGQSTEHPGYLFGPPEAKGNYFDINFGYFSGCGKFSGDGFCCHTTGDTWRFSVIGTHVRLTRVAVGWMGTGCGVP